MYMLLTFCTFLIAMGAGGPYIKVFDDPFTNLDNWIPEEVGPENGNNEWQYYTGRANNVRVENRQGRNVLVLTAQEEEYQGLNYTSGRVHSEREFGPYAFVNINALVPKADCLWPAIWMLPTDAKSKYGTWAACGEIDIMETVCSAQSDEAAYATLQFGGPWPKNVAYPTYDQNAYPVSVDWTKPHNFGVEWQPDSIKFWLDAEIIGGQVVGTLLNTIASDVWFSMDAEGERQKAGAPFDVPFGIVLNIAVGGNFPAAFDGCCDTVAVPAEMVVYKAQVWHKLWVEEVN